ncbi:thioether cross-link-forming SCIFF peptide maturase [Alkaliphilus serpentinus]|uniref:Thioether cross-link-forming SCIFF peptide maturase n=1 Tax=Alkaliphilus serpentinus TaxID=1482731 RepID=A0A833HML4_9FIRM|nr:thioether cross-link-forming SCIFF peptide maturase [Alkaliphilus serpentinus]KAB3527673.1 thioether cross-link-forming SCIFF peptide maturase [Alkaliphilus serpentinus]
MIHKFQQGGRYILMDVNSGGVHLIDKLVYKILDYYPDKGEAEIVEILSNEFTVSEVKEALEEIHLLVQNGLLYKEDHYHQHESFKNKKPVVKALCLHVSHDCNIRCKYCFASQGDFKGQRTLMDSEIGKKAIDFLLTHSGNRRNLEVDFFGGEPLLNFEMVKEIVDYGREREKEYGKNLRFTMTTNGVLLDDEKMDYINKNMHNVVLSIDGREEVNDTMRYTVKGKGTYDVILPKLKKMAEIRNHEGYYVRGTFTSFNLDFSKDVLHLADLGFKNISVEPVVAEANQDYAIKEEDLPTVFNHYEQLAEEYVKRKKEGRDFNFFHFMIDLNQGPCVIKRIVGCGAGAEYIAVTPEGDLYPCHQFVGNEDFKIGSVVTGELNRDMYHSFSEAHVYNKEKCTQCWAKFYCSGGCHANAYNFNNDIMVPYDIGCEMEKKRVECALYIQARLLEEED